ncbi:MAG: tetratricopeptide repeat protein [Candidatus Riflebacteria bacterium]|nr:tetratricopeptide repeat protein [Candidatus Riflebacteria bacterium]
MKKLVYTGFLVLFLNLPAFALSLDALPAYQDEGMKLYIRGTSRLQENNCTEAVSDLTKAVKLRPDIPEAFHNLGYAFERCGDVKNAIRAYERALNLKPAYPSALNNLGYLLATTEQDLIQAIGLCQRAVQLSPNTPSFRDSLGWALYKSNRNQEAAEQFQTALRLDPTFYKSYFNLGLVEYTAGNYSAAARNFQNTIRCNSNYAKAYVSLGDCYEKLNDDNKALNAYRQALNKISDNDPIKKHLNKKIKQLTSESKKQLFASTQKMTSTNSKGQGSSLLQDFLNKHNRSGNNSKSNNSNKTSVASAYNYESNSSFTPVSATSFASNYSSSYAPNSYMTASNYNSIPTYSPQTSVISTPLIDTSRSAIAERNARETNTISSSYYASSAKVENTAPRQISVAQERELERKYSLAKSYMDRGLTAEAANELNYIISQAPETSMVSRQSRNMLLKVKKQLDETNDKKADTHRDMGKDFFRSGQYQLAEEEFNKALRLAPDNAEVYKDLALLNYNQGKYEVAYEQSKKAIALDRTLKEAYVVLASLYAQKGRQEDAIRTLKMVKEVSTRTDAVDELAERMMAQLQSY